MHNNPKLELKTFYQALDDRPLRPDEDSALYEHFVEKLPDGDPMAELLTGISFSSSESLHFFSGQRGTGKSTELLRLRGMLSEAGYSVFYVDMLKYLHDAEPVEITDFLLAAVAGLAGQVKADERLDDQLQESWWERLYQFLHSEVELEGLKLKGEVAGFGAELTTRLQRDVSFKRQLQQAAGGHLLKLLENVQEFATELVRSVRALYNDLDREVVFIIDSFEQIRGRGASAPEVHDSVVRLFSTHGNNLRLPQLHMVITIPPWLATSAPNTTRPTGANPVITLPSIHVQDKAGDEDARGIEILGNILKKRHPRAPEIFNDAAIARLARASGGDLRDFFSMARTALIKASTGLTLELPLGGKIIEQAREALRRSMLPITDEDVRWLARVNQSKAAEIETSKNLPWLARLFDANLIINYRNGEDWYDIHPLIRDYVEQRMAILNERATDA